MLYDNIEDLIGDTPLLKIDGNRYGLRDADIYMKLEYLNPFGSIKDRTALGLTDEVRHKLGPDYGLIESSSGNTARALALLASRRGAKFTSVTNRIKVPEVDMLMRYLGAEIIALPGRSECPDPNDSGNALSVIQTMEQENPGKYYHTRQYENTANPNVHSNTTAKELYDTLGEIDVFVSGVGTGGSSGGVIDYANKNGKNTKYIGVISDSNDFLPGIRSRAELFETPLFNVNMFDDLMRVNTSEALDFLRQLVLNEGVLAGPTTGANFAAAIKYAKQTAANHSGEITKKRKIVCIACDRLEGYMSYIAKRQPELFAKSNFTDIYSIKPTDDERQLAEKSATAATEAWIENSRACVVDMRGVKPYNNFKIKSSINYPEAHLVEVLETGTPFDKSRPVLLVCPTGERSLLLAVALRRRGFDAFSLAGGLMAWRRANLNLERGFKVGA